MQLLVRIILLFKFILLINASHFDIKFNFNVPYLNDSLVQSYNKLLQYQCLAECDKLNDCTGCSFDKLTTGVNCFLYTQSFEENQLVPSATTDFYFKKVPHLLKFFQNPQKYTTKVIRVNSIDELRNFETYVDNFNRIYYYLARVTLIDVYDIDWNFVSSYPTPGIAYYIKIVENKDVYLSLMDNIVKTDLLMRVVRQANQTSNSYRETFFYKKTNLIYATNVFGHRIDIFNRELDLVDSIYTGRNNHAVYLHLDDVYVGTNSGVIMKYRNKTLIYQIQTPCSNFIFSLVLDKYGSMVSVCQDFSFFLYHSNGTFMNLSIAMNSVRYLNFDRKFQTVALSSGLIDIYKFIDV